MGDGVSGSEILAEMGGALELVYWFEADFSGDRVEEQASRQLDPRPLDGCGSDQESRHRSFVIDNAITEQPVSLPPRRNVFRLSGIPVHQRVLTTDSGVEMSVEDKPFPIATRETRHDGGPLWYQPDS